MNKVLVAALRYAQGPGATSGLATEMLGLGLRGPVCIIASRSAQRELEATWTTVFAAAAERATIASDTIHNEPFPVTAAAVLQAIKRADAAGRAAIQ